MQLNRRNFLSLALPTIAVGAGIAPAKVFAGGGDWRKGLLSGERKLIIRRMGLPGGLQEIRYAKDDQTLDREGYIALCLLLRDVKADRVFPMSTRTLDILCGMQMWALANRRYAPIVAHSGFRTFATNNAIEGAKKNSMHLAGRAVDFHLDGFTISQTGAMALEFNREGGNGIYLGKHSVHSDDAAPRVWRG